MVKIDEKRVPPHSTRHLRFETFGWRFRAGTVMFMGKRADGPGGSYAGMKVEYKVQ